MFLSRVDEELGLLFMTAQFGAHLRHMIRRADNVLIADMILHRTRGSVSDRPMRAFFAVRCDFRLDDDRPVEVDEATEYIGAANCIEALAAAHADTVKSDAVLNR